VASGGGAAPAPNSFLMRLIPALHVQARPLAIRRRAFSGRAGAGQYDKGRAGILDRRGRREAASGHFGFRQKPHQK
jgi:hypothetical protein